MTSNGRLDRLCHRIDPTSRSLRSGRWMSIGSRRLDPFRFSSDSGVCPAVFRVLVRFDCEFVSWVVPFVLPTASVDSLVESFLPAGDVESFFAKSCSVFESEPHPTVKTIKQMAPNHLQTPFAVIRFARVCLVASGRVVFMEFPFEIGC